MLTDTRFSRRLSDFAAALKGLDPKEQHKALAAVEFGPKEVSRKLAGGTKVYARGVSLDGLPAAVPPSLKEDARMLVAHAGVEAAARGELWAAEGLYLAVAEGLGIKLPA